MIVCVVEVGRLPPVVLSVAVVVPVMENALCPFIRVAVLPEVGNLLVGRSREDVGYLLSRLPPLQVKTKLLNPMGIVICTRIVRTPTTDNHGAFGGCLNGGVSGGHDGTGTGLPSWTGGTACLHKVSLEQRVGWARALLRVPLESRRN